MQERLQSAEETISQFEDFKKRASLREAALNSKVESLHSVAEEFAQNERLLQGKTPQSPSLEHVRVSDHYAQSREISRRKEAELKERLDEQCLISESLNDAVEEMHRLITTMIEANDAVATGPHQVVEQDRSVATEARQIASLPDVPVDPITNAVQADAAAPDHDAIQRFVTTVYITLFSLPHGYDSLAVLLRDLKYAHMHVRSSRCAFLLQRRLGTEGRSRGKGVGLRVVRSLPSVARDGSPDPCWSSSQWTSAVQSLPNQSGFGAIRRSTTRHRLWRLKVSRFGFLSSNTHGSRRALARQREENNKLRRQLASTMERVEKLKSEPLRAMPAIDSSRFKKQPTNNRSSDENKS
ncbi:hypothetical protein AAVH_31396, partial [Aphelenchoides avenae]